MAKKKQQHRKQSAKVSFVHKIPLVVLVLLFVASWGYVALTFAQPPSKSEHEAHQEHGASSVAYEADANNIVTIKEVGMQMKLSENLAEQGLRGVVTHDHVNNSTSIAFTTAALHESNSQCDGINGWIGVMTRYEGPASAMSEHSHVHGSTNFDFPGFHINYRTLPVQSCTVASHDNYVPQELKKETTANRELWDAMRTAEPLAAN